jgi:redox-sensitive bicupin YhaK (pirin superfamily)
MLVIDQRRRDIGGGFEVGRVLPFAARRMVGPFIFFDQMGPADFAPGIPNTLDVRPHPHIGLATVTYLFSGEIMHRDSVGSEQAIVPGEMNWMIAGSGVTHSERFEKARASGDHLHGIQAWVALPKADEEIAPSFDHHMDADLPTYQDKDMWARLIAGEVRGAKAKVNTRSPMFYAHWRLNAGAAAGLSAEYSERAAFIVSGQVEIDNRAYDAGKMIVFDAGAPVVFKAMTPVEMMLLGGEPVGERFIEWNFVSSSRDRIEQAKADWRAGRMKLPDLDNQEFIPLPGS